MKKLILLALLCSGLLHAQNPAPAADAAIHVSFKTIGFKFGRGDIFIKQEKGYAPLAIQSDCISVKSYAYAGPLVMPVYRKVKSADKVSYQPVGQVTFPALDPKQTARFLLIFSGGATAGAMNINAVNDDLAAFPLQTIRVINALPGQAGVMVNKTSYVIPSGQIQCFPLQSENRAEIHVAVQHHDKWVEANNNVYSCDSTSRLTIFLVNTTSPNAPAYQPPSIDFLSLSDRPSEKEKAPQGDSVAAATQR